MLCIHLKWLLVLGRWQLALGCHQMCPLDLRGSQVRDWGGKMVERWCDSSSSKNVRHESKKKRETCSCCIVHCRHVMTQKIEESALSFSDGLLDKCFCWNVKKALRLEIFSIRGQRQERRRCTIYCEMYLSGIFRLQYTSSLHLRRWWNSPARAVDLSKPFLLLCNCYCHFLAKHLPLRASWADEFYYLLNVLETNREVPVLWAAHRGSGLWHTTFAPLLFAMNKEEGE